MVTIMQESPNTNSDKVEHKSEGQAIETEKINPQRLQANFNRPILVGGRIFRAISAPAAGLVSSPVVS